MFLPGQSWEAEKAKRQAAYTQIEEWCKSLIESDIVRQSCLITVQEVQCGDPQCAPIDTVVTISFESGGQGMFALPMEPKEVTRELLEDSFPTPEVLEKWLNGEDAEWPPMSDAPVELRFNVGTPVVCRVGPDLWESGTISQQWYRENQWPEGAYAPYQIVLDDGRAIFAPFDSDQVIRLNSNKTTAAPNMADSNTRIDSSK